MKREIEILYGLKDNVDCALKKLRHCKPVYIKRRIIDTYYYDPLRDTLKPSNTGRLSSCFRVREKGHQTLMTYKVDHFDDDLWLYSDEYETGVKSLAAAKHIFAQLGLEELVVVDSVKSVFSSDKFDVVIETIDGLGSFIEVEYRYSNDIKDVSVAKEHIREWLDEVGVEVGEEMNSGKPELLLRLRSKA